MRIKYFPKQPKLINDLSDINIVNISDNDILQFNSATGKWENAVLSGGGGAHNSLSGLQGGTAGEYYHLTQARHTDLTDGGDSTLHFHSADRDRANHTGTQAASTISDFDTEVSNNTDVAANTAARHDAVSVTDTLTIDLSITGQEISGAVIPGGVDHDALLNTHNLTTDIDHDTITNTHNLTTDIDHTTISSIGTNSHAQIDTHIADATIHFSEGSIDHGSITGLGDDDHSQYALLAGRSGGQTLVGGTGSGENLTLQSTIHATVGEVDIVDPIRMGSARDTFFTNSIDPFMFRTGGGAGDFDAEAGHLVLQPRTSAGAARDIIFGLGDTTATEYFRMTSGGVLRVSRTGSIYTEIYNASSGNFVVDLTGGTVGYIDLRPADSSHGLILRETDGTGTGVYASISVVDSSPDYLNIAVDNTSASVPALTVTSGHQVGIGTFTPGADLGFANTLGMKVALYDSTYGFGIQGSLLENIVSASTANFAWGYGTSGSLTRAMTLDTDVGLGIGTANPSQKLDVNGDAKIGSMNFYTLSRTLPTTVNNTVDIGTFVTSAGPESLDIKINVGDSAFSVAKSYIISTQYNDSAGAWRIVSAISDTGVFGGNDYQLEASQTTGTLSLRIRRTGGSTAGTADINLITSDSATFTPSTSVGTGVAVVTDSWDSALLTQVNGNVGIGMTNSSIIQGRLHGFNSVSGFLHWEYDGLDGTARTIIPNGVGDVTSSVVFFFNLLGSDASQKVTSGAVLNGGTFDTTVGANTVRFAVSAAGAFTAQRTVGSATIKVGLWCVWI